MKASLSNFQVIRIFISCLILCKMKNTLLTVFLIITSLGNILAQDENGPSFKFIESKHDFGDIIQGDVVEHHFEFSNVGDLPLIISNIITTCGCTAPTRPKEPVNPGEKGKIKIVFDSKGKIGKQNKVVTIISNSSNQKDRLFLMANVIPGSGL